MREEPRDGGSWNESIGEKRERERERSRGPSVRVPKTPFTGYSKTNVLLSCSIFFIMILLLSL